MGEWLFSTEAEFFVAVMRKYHYWYRKRQGIMKPNGNMLQMKQQLKLKVVKKEIAKVKETNIKNYLHTQFKICE